MKPPLPQIIACRRLARKEAAALYSRARTMLTTLATLVLLIAHMESPKKRRAPLQEIKARAGVQDMDTGHPRLVGIGRQYGAEIRKRVEDVLEAQRIDLATDLDAGATLAWLPKAVQAPDFAPDQMPNLVLLALYAQAKSVDLTKLMDPVPVVRQAVDDWNTQARTEVQTAMAQQSIGDECWSEGRFAPVLRWMYRHALLGARSPWPDVVLVADWLIDRQDLDEASFSRMSIPIVVASVNAEHLAARGGMNPWDEYYKDVARFRASGWVPDSGAVLMRWPTGFKLVDLTSWPQLQQETTVMGHCVGSPEHGPYYWGKVKDGTGRIWSLRTADGYSVVTIEVSLNAAGQPTAFPQVYGPKDTYALLTFVDPIIDAARNFGVPLDKIPNYLIKSILQKASPSHASFKFILDNPALAYQYAAGHGGSDALRQAASKDPAHAVAYATHVDEEPHEVTRTGASADPIQAYQYAVHVDQGPHPQTRAGACREAEQALQYARNVDHAPTVETMIACANSADMLIEYFRVLGGDWSTLAQWRTPALARGPAIAGAWARAVDKDMREDTAEIIATDPIESATCFIAFALKMGDWPEIDQAIDSMPIPALAVHLGHATTGPISPDVYEKILEDPVAAALLSNWMEEGGTMHGLSDRALDSILHAPLPAWMMDQVHSLEWAMRPGRRRRASPASARESTLLRNLTRFDDAIERIENRFTDVDEVEENLVRTTLIAEALSTPRKAALTTEALALLATAPTDVQVSLFPHMCTANPDLILAPELEQIFSHPDMVSVIVPDAEVAGEVIESYTKLMARRGVRRRMISTAHSAWVVASRVDMRSNEDTFLQAATDRSFLRQYLDRFATDRRSIPKAVRITMALSGTVDTDFAASMGFFHRAIETTSGHGRSRNTSRRYAVREVQDALAVHAADHALRLLFTRLHGQKGVREDLKERIGRYGDNLDRKIEVVDLYMPGRFDWYTKKAWTGPLTDKPDPTPEMAIAIATEGKVPQAVFVPIPGVDSGYPTLRVPAIGSPDSGRFNGGDDQAAMTFFERWWRAAKPNERKIALRRAHTGTVQVNFEAAQVAQRFAVLFGAATPLDAEALLVSPVLTYIRPENLPLVAVEQAILKNGAVGWRLLLPYSDDWAQMKMGPAYSRFVRKPE